MDLLTTNEILRLNPVFKTTDMANYCTNITHVEYSCFTGCFPIELRQEMIDDRVLYPNLQSFQEETLYNEGDYCIFMNNIYVSKEDDNYDNLESSKWELGKYFEQEKFNKLWEFGFGKYLSLKVIIESLPFVWMQIDGKGIGSIYEDSGFRTVDKAGYYTILKSLEHTANLCLKASKNYYDLNFVSIDATCKVKGICEEEDARIAW